MTSRDYDLSSISFNTDEIQEVAKLLVVCNLGIELEIERIEEVVFKLELGWAGTTAAEADEFKDLWQTAMLSMFGTGKKNPDPSKPMPAADQGVLNEMAGGVSQVATGFSALEDQLRKSFGQFSDGLKNPSPPPASPAPSAPPVPSAIIETFPDR